MTDDTARGEAIDRLHRMFVRLSDRPSTPDAANRQWESLRNEAEEIVDAIIQADDRAMREITPTAAAVELRKRGWSLRDDGWWQHPRTKTLFANEYVVHEPRHALDAMENNLLAPIAAHLRATP